MDDCKSKTIDEVAKSVVTDDVPMDYGPFEAMSRQGMDLLHRLTQRDPSKRITAEAALEHPWFREQLGFCCQPGMACSTSTVTLETPACSIFGPCSLIETAVDAAC